MARAKIPHGAQKERSGSAQRSPAAPRSDLGNQELQALRRRHPTVEVGRSGDVSEQEAHRMADRVLQMESPSPEPGSTMDRKPESAAPVRALSLGEGKPLDPAERSYFEPRFGMALDEVRVHSGPEAADSAAAVRASAYTLGDDIVFGEERYQPGTTAGRRLLAHELAHVAQARGGGRPVIRREPVDDDHHRSHEHDHEKDDSHEEPPPDDYQGIINRALASLTTGDGEDFYWLDPTFGEELRVFGSNLMNPGLLPDMGSNEGWLRKQCSPLFASVGYKPGQFFYAMVIHKGVHFLVRTAIHTQTILKEGTKEGYFPDALEASRIFPDWADRLEAHRRAEEAKKKKK